MRKMCRCVALCALLAAIIWTGGVLFDRQKLMDSVIRMHVVANSDSHGDQSLKLSVRDAVTASLQQNLAAAADPEEARAYLEKSLPKIKHLAEQTLFDLGCDASVAVSLCREAFPKRVYDTFSLPAGVYEALRITIGEGKGQNWWCVVFPQLCLGTSASKVQDVAAGAGFPDSLHGALVSDGGYEIRFAAMDALGKLENIFFDD